MTVDEFVQQIAPYFQSGKLDVLEPLASSDYDEVLSLIDRAIDEHPTECAFWFWRGWALQFFGDSQDCLSQHPDFELIEDAYGRVLELDSTRSEAYFMLAYLYWDSAKRAKAVPASNQFDLPEPDLDPEIANFNEACWQWELFKENDGLGVIMEVRWTLYPFQVQVWSELLKRMLTDLVAADDLMEVYLSWGYHWLDCDFGANNRSKRKVAYEQARCAFAAGAALAGDKHTYAMKLDCHYMYASLQSAKYGGDPVVGLKAWIAYVELAVEYGCKYCPTATPAVPCFEGNNTHYSEEDIQKFWSENPLLENSHEPLTIILQLEALGALDLSKPGNGRLSWYLGRQFARRHEWDRAERYLTTAQHNLPSESNLISQLASVLKKQGKARERVEVLRLMPGDTPLEQLVRELAEDNSSLHDTEDLRREIKQMREEVGKEATQDEEARRKCALDLHGTWPLLPASLQNLIVTGELMHLALPRNSLPDYSSLIAHWGKVTEILLHEAVLAPFALYLDRIGHRSSILIQCRGDSGKFKSNQIERLRNTASWIESFDALKAHEVVGILYAARNNGNTHIYYQFLTELKLSPQQIAAWLNLVPDQVNVIRERRNEAVHGQQCYILSDALDVRSILFSGGLIAQIGILLKHTRIPVRV